MSQPPRDPTLLRLSAGFIYFFFGCLKFFPDLSPAELLAAQTVMKLSNHMLDATTALWYLSLMECFIGLCFLFRFKMHTVFFLFLAHQISTFLPLFLFPEYTFKIAPFAPTMEGQYILKNVVSVAAGWTVLWPAAKARWFSSNQDPALPDLDDADDELDVPFVLPLELPQPAVSEANA